jgi:hypothetical protein
MLYRYANMDYIFGTAIRNTSPNTPVLFTPPPIPTGLQDSSRIPTGLQDSSRIPTGLLLDSWTPVRFLLDSYWTPGLQLDSYWIPTGLSVQ